MQRNAEYVAAQASESPPKPGPTVTGRYKAEVPPLTMPPDPIRPYQSGFKKRKRRSDWPVLVFALVVTVAVTAGCCLAGFALFTAWRPFGS